MKACNHFAHIQIMNHTPTVFKTLNYSFHNIMCDWVLKVKSQSINTKNTYIRKKREREREREREDIQLQQGHLWAPFRGQCSLWLGPQAHHNNHVLEFLLSFPYEWSVILHKNIKNSSKLKDIREPKQNYYTF